MTCFEGQLQQTPEHADSEALFNPEDDVDTQINEDGDSEFEGESQDMDLDHDEPDTAISTKSKGKETKKKGLIARDQINTIASRLGPDSAEGDRGPNAAETKRKVGPSPVE